MPSTHAPWNDDDGDGDDDDGGDMVTHFLSVHVARTWVSEVLYTVRLQVRCTPCPAGHPHLQASVISSGQGEDRTERMHLHGLPCSTFAVQEGLQALTHCTNMGIAAGRTSKWQVGACAA